ncbi:ABC transporter substrate-binding protein [Actinomyces vulturis]|uniref:ABC transporter substrate-binding protein n=1 Tax=Actinomyces vulturis TaxID=1857645 RepID=UPI00082E578C|nr:ABC transporter substrate-binding protein [Actinomyces vulturis]
MKRRTMLTALALTPVLASAACGRGGKENSANASTIAVIAKGASSPFWNATKEGAMKAGKELGIEVTFNGPDSESDVARQIDQLNQVFVKHPTALVFAALDAESEAAALQQFADASIPVVAFDSGVPGSSIPVSTVATDNVAASADAAKHMSDLLGGQGEVAIVCNSQTSLSGQQREQGFKDYLAENAPGITVVDVQYNNSDQAVAEQQASAMLQAHPNLAGMYATDDDGAVAAAQVVKRAGANVTVVGFDSGKYQMDLIREGAIAGSVTQNPFKMGYTAVMTAWDAAQGKEVEKTVDSGFAWYDKDNIDTPEIQEAVYD